MVNVTDPGQGGGVVSPPASTSVASDNSGDQASGLGQSQVVPAAQSTPVQSVSAPGVSIAEHTLIAQELEQIKSQNKNLSNENAKRRIEMNNLTAELAATVGLDSWDYEAYAKRVAHMTSENTRLRQEQLVAEVATEKGIDDKLLLTLLRGEARLPTMFTDATRVELLNITDEMMARYPGIKPNSPVGGLPTKNSGTSPVPQDIYTVEQLERLSADEQRKNREKVTRSLAHFGFS